MLFGYLLVGGLLNNYQRKNSQKYALFELKYPSDSRWKYDLVLSL